MKLSKKNRWSFTGIIISVLILVAVGVIALNMITAPGESNSRGPRSSGINSGRSDLSRESEILYSVKTENVKLTSLEDYLKLNGDIVTSTSVDIYPDTSGKLSKLLVSLGDYVTKGETIAEVDPSLPGQVFSTSPVKSTISGTVIDLPYRVGSTLSSTQIPVASVGDLTDLLVQVYVSERDISGITLGLNGIITFDAYKDSTFNGSVTEISPVLDRSSRTLGIKLSIKERDSRIKSGMFASVKLITKRLEDIIVVSSDCLVESSEGKYVYTIDSSNTAHKVNVETGLEIDGMVEIISGLDEDLIVVYRGQSMISDGDTVRISK